MKINIITTMDIEEEVLTGDIIDRIYEDFREIVRETHESSDLTCFTFVNADTNRIIDDEEDEI